jgi:hypothetical protein
VEFAVAFNEVCFRSVLSHASFPFKDRVRMGITDNLVRLSVGLEDPEDIIADLELAFRPAVSVFYGERRIYTYIFHNYELLRCYG